MNTSVTDASEAEQDWQRWRARRKAELSKPYGWLSLTGLHWLTPHPRRLPGIPGQWWHDQASLWVRAGADEPPLTVDGAPVTGPVCVLRTEGRASTVHAGRARLEPLNRSGVWGLRVRDPDAPTRAAFAGVPIFDYHPAWVVRGRFEPFASGPRVTATGSVADGIEHAVELAGLARLTIDGQEHRLQVGPGDHPTVVFRDATSGIESYPALRFVPATVSEQEVVIDFNRAVNPPCAFTDFGTCPLPPPGNTLTVRITAGERWPGAGGVPG